MANLVIIADPEPTLVLARLLVAFLPALPCPGPRFAHLKWQWALQALSLPLTRVSPDLQTPALIPTDADIIKRAGYFSWDESAFIHRRGEEVSAVEQNEGAGEDSSMF